MGGASGRGRGGLVWRGAGPGGGGGARRCRGRGGGGRGGLVLRGLKWMMIGMG